MSGFSNKGLVTLRKIEGLEEVINQTKVVLEDWLIREGKGDEEDNDVISFISSLGRLSSTIPKMKEKFERGKGPSPSSQGPQGDSNQVQEDEVEIGGYQCPSCGEEFLRNSTLETHMIMKHWNKGGGGGKGFRCHLCQSSAKKGNKELDKVYKNRAALRIHMTKEHGGDCEECGKEFIIKWMLEMHVKRVHQKDHKMDTTTDSKPKSPSSLPSRQLLFQCNICFVGFTRKNMLMSHLRDVHNFRDLNQEEDGNDGRCEVDVGVKIEQSESSEEEEMERDPLGGSPDTEIKEEEGEEVPGIPLGFEAIMPDNIQEPGSVSAQMSLSKYKRIAPAPLPLQPQPPVPTTSTTVPFQQFPFLPLGNTYIILPPITTNNNNVNLNPRNP